MHKSHLQALCIPNRTITINDEFGALISIKTWVLVLRPMRADVVQSMWLLRKKCKTYSSLGRYKTCMVADEKCQRPSIYCGKTFNLFVKVETIWYVLSIAVSHHSMIYQLYVKNAFLHGQLNEIVYMHRPLRFHDSTHLNHICLR